MPKIFAEIVAELRPIYESKSKKTAVEFESVTRLHLLPYFGDKCVSTVGMFWPHYCADQKQKNPNRKLWHDRKVLRAILGFAFDMEFVHKIPRLKLDRVDTAKTRIGREVSPEEIKRFCFFASQTMADIVSLSFWTGMRFGECRQMKSEWVDFGTGYITIPRHVVKTREPRTYPIPPEVRDLLKIRCGLREKGFLFCSVGDPLRCISNSQRTFQRAIKAAGLSFTFHDLRRSFITRKLREGMPCEVLAKLVGASPDVMRDSYLKVKREDWEKQADAPHVPARENFFFPVRDLQIH